jgi:hypothetical protein
MNEQDTMLSRTAAAQGSRKTEIRFEVEASECSVLDGYCQATGKDRTRVIRELLEKWSVETLHVSTLVCRVSGRNPFESESSRE